MITLPQLAMAAPHAASAGRLAVWHPALCSAMDEFDISTSMRQTMFLANLLEETGELAVQRENMNYSAARLLQIWPALFSSAQQAYALSAEGPEAIANFVYADANRPDGYKLGNTQPGDGWKFRGTGPMQTTGRANVEAALMALGLPIDADPNVFCRPVEGSRAAAFFWRSAGCNELADDGDFESVVRRVNGGLTNLSTREVYLMALEQATTVTA